MIEQNITPIETVPLRSAATSETEYRQKVEVFLASIKKMSEEFGIAIPQINSTATTINEKEVSAVSAEANATSAQVIATQKATIATDQATIAINSASQANASAQVCAAYANMQWTGFGVTDGELIVSIADASVSTPSIMDGEFIITLGA